MQTRILFIAAAAYGVCLAGSQAAQQYRVEAGSLFVPAAGAPASLSGTFTWADPVQVPNPHVFGGFVTLLDATTLDFQAGGLAFHLNTSPLNSCGTILSGGAMAGQMNFCEVVDLFDGTGTLLEAGLRLTGAGQPGLGGSGQIEFPDLAIYRLWDSPDPEFVGQMTLSVVPVPEPAPGVLVALGLATLFFVHQRTWHRLSKNKATGATNCQPATRQR